MWRRRNCGCRNSLFPWGHILIAVGVGLILAYIIPYYILITLLGIGLVIAGVCFMKRR